MRVRKIIATEKTIVSDTGWRIDNIAPRYAPYMVRSRPNARYWKWRSLTARDNTGMEYVLLVLCNTMKGDWKSTLCIKLANAASVVGRLEYHDSHPGIHFHSDCKRSGKELGATGMDKLTRFPNANSNHRRIVTWRENSFLEASKQFFRITEAEGGLI